MYLNCFTLYNYIKRNVLHIIFFPALLYNNFRIFAISKSYRIFTYLKRIESKCLSAKSFILILLFLNVCFCVRCACISKNIAYISRLVFWKIFTTAEWGCCSDIDVRSLPYCLASYSALFCRFFFSDIFCLRYTYRWPNSVGRPHIA